MLVTAVIFGWIGVFIYLTVIFSVKKLMQNYEFGFMHILFVFMYALWLPVPMVMYQLLGSDVLLAGSMFGYLYLFMLIISMALQTGHINYLVKQNEGKGISDEQGAYMMTTLSHPFESIAGVFKSIWALFLAIAFWENGTVWMAVLMSAFGLLVFYYLFMAIDASLVKRIKLFFKVKPNTYCINLETLLFFFSLVLYMSVFLLNQPG
ncbi:hypothetical protein [Virgibacillus kimchii]